MSHDPSLSLEDFERQFPENIRFLARDLYQLNSRLSFADEEARRFSHFREIGLSPLFQSTALVHALQRVGSGVPEEGDIEAIAKGIKERVTGDPVAVFERFTQAVADEAKGRIRQRFEKFLVEKQAEDTLRREEEMRQRAEEEFFRQSEELLRQTQQFQQERQRQIAELEAETQNFTQGGSFNFTPFTFSTRAFASSSSQVQPFGFSLPVGQTSSGFNFIF